MAYKHLLYCPTDHKTLRDMVSSHSGEETYHCEDCDTYWHFKWFKHYPEGSKRYKWRIEYIRDDFGQLFALTYTQ